MSEKHGGQVGDKVRVAGAVVGTVLLVGVAVYLFTNFGVWFVVISPATVFLAVVIIVVAISPLLLLLVSVSSGIERLQVRRAAEAERRESEALENPRSALNDRDKYLRRKAVWLLAERKDYGAVEALVGALGDEDEEVRCGAARALGEVGAEEAVGPLVGTLSSDSAGVRRVGAMALGRIGDVRALEALRRMAADDGDEQARWAATWAARQME